MIEDSRERISHGLTQLRQTIWDELIENGQLTAVEIPVHLRCLSGSTAESQITLNTQRFAGARYDSLTVATLATEDGRLCSLTVVGLPSQTSRAPILGVDLIALRGVFSLIAVDLAPLDDAYWQVHSAPLLSQLESDLSSLVVMRKRPLFTEGTFSPLALIAGGQKGQELQILAAVQVFLRSVAVQSADRMVVTSREEMNVIHAKRERWLSAERQNRKEHNALARLFGPDLASEYLERFLFAAAAADPADASVRMTSQNAEISYGHSA
jgi:hypothetical protein